MEAQACGYDSCDRLCVVAVGSSGNGRHGTGHSAASQGSGEGRAWALAWQLEWRQGMTIEARGGGGGGGGGIME